MLGSSAINAAVPVQTISICLIRVQYQDIWNEYTTSELILNIFPSPVLEAAVSIGAVSGDTQSCVFKGLVGLISVAVHSYI